MISLNYTMHRRAVLPAFATAAALALMAGTAFADNPPPSHEGDPALWGPPLLQVCSSPGLAQQAGYNVIEGDNNANTLTAGPAADAIFGWGGNDTLYGASGDDVICGGFGNDKMRGEQGGDALFGEAHNDTLKGDKARDFLDGGGQTDDCDGGSSADAGANCETAVSIP